jgi:hypothetical protein
MDVELTFVIKGIINKYIRSLISREKSFARVKGAIGF